MSKLIYSSQEDKIAQKKILKNRLFFALGFMLLLFTLLITRMAYLQWINFQHYKGMADGNRITQQIIPPTRGKIFDRNGFLLADNQPFFVLTFSKKNMDSITQTHTQLAKLLPLLSERTLSKFFNHLSRYRSVKKQTLPISLSEKQASIFAVNSHLFPGVTLAAKLKREYPYPLSLSHALGYTGKINQKDLARLNRERYLGTDTTGKTGIEKKYEDTLQGYPGFRQVETNARGGVLRTLSTTPATAGKDISLTIDIKLQQYIEKLLGDQKAAVVVMDPQTGEILAFVSAPTYDLNLFTDGISHKNYNRLINNKDRPLINRATQGQYPPGSTVKPFVSLGSLERGIVHADHKIFDPGYFVFKDHHYRDWKRRGHGIVDMKTAIQQSCDTYYYDLSLKMGIDTIHDSLYPFGFGHKTNIDLPSERVGILPSKAWKKETKGVGWYTGETIISIIGQGYFLSTPLQLAKATSILANRGKIITPHLVKTGKRINEPHITIQNNDHWEAVIDAMESVLHTRRGTAYKYARKLDFKMAGKTGTAQVFSLNNEEYDAKKIRKTLRDHSLFIGFAPLQSPKIAISVVIENAEVKAAQIGIDITKFYMDQQRKQNPQ